MGQLACFGYLPARLVSWFEIGFESYNFDPRSMIMFIRYYTVTYSMDEYKTGENAPESGTYVWVRPADNKLSCTPTSEEREIILSKDEKFPPVRSCDSAGGAIWKKKK